LENIRLQDIDWQVTGPIPDPPVTKPTGSARTRIDPVRPKYESDPAHILAIHCPGLYVEGLRLGGSDSGRPFLSNLNHTP
jgi:hypothetical protein